MSHTAINHVNPCQQKYLPRHATLLLINVILKRKSRLLSNFCILIYSIYNNNVTNNHSSCSRVKSPPPHPQEKKQIKNMTWLWYLNRNSLSKSQPKRISIFNHNFIFLQYSWGMPYGHFHRNFGKFAPLIIFLYSTLFHHDWWPMHFYITTVI